MTAIRSTGRAALAQLGVMLGVMGMATSAQAYWGGYGEYSDGPRPYYGAPPAYYVPFYRPRVLFVPPPIYDAPAYAEPQGMPRVAPRPVPRTAPRVALVHPKPAPHREIRHAALRVVPPLRLAPAAPGPAVHATPRAGDLPWLPKAATPAAVPAGALPAGTGPTATAPVAAVPMTLPPLAPAPAVTAPTERPFTPFVGD